MIRRLVLGMLAAVLLAACSSTPKAPVEELKGGTSAPTSTAGAQTGQARGGAPAVQTTTTGIAQGKSSGSEAGAAGAGSTGPAPNSVPAPGPDHPPAKRIVYFDFDSSLIRAEFDPLIEANAAYLRAHPGVKVTLQGNTDERGSREYNLALGQRRADSVLQAMKLLGVPAGRMEAVSFGEEKPVALGHDEAAWKLNRRTVIAYPNETNGH